jgi:hypothetical protein
MAYFVCTQHGGHGAAKVCSHVAQDLLVSKDRAAQVERLLVVRANYEGTSLGPIWLCRECAKLHGVPSEGLYLEGEAGLERYLGNIGFAPVCPVCFEQAYGVCV